MLIRSMLLLISLAVPPQSQHPLQGEWSGRYSTSEGENELSLKVGRANGEWSVAVKATSAHHPNPTYLSASNVKVDRDRLSFTLQWGSPVDWHGTLKGDALSGEMTAEHWSGRWSVKRKQD